jgi:hypothetical protein
VRAKCRLEAELAAKADAERRAALKQAKDAMERGEADELAGAMNEFFEALCVEQGAREDQITVTMEFGVTEEGGSFTVISAGGSGGYVNAGGSAGEMDVEMTEDVDGDGVGVETMMDVSDDEENDDGDGDGDGDGDVDTDGDAEAALIEEFMHAHDAE